MDEIEVRAKLSTSPRGPGETGRGEHSVIIEWFRDGQRAVVERYDDLSGLDRLVGLLGARGIDTAEVERARTRLRDLLDRDEITQALRIR